MTAVSQQVELLRNRRFRALPGRFLKVISFHARARASGDEGRRAGDLDTVPKALFKGAVLVIAFVAGADAVDVRSTADEWK